MNTQLEKTKFNILTTEQFKKLVNSRTGWTHKTEFQVYKKDDPSKWEGRVFRHSMKNGVTITYALDCFFDSVQKNLLILLTSMKSSWALKNCRILDPQYERVSKHLLDDGATSVWLPQLFPKIKTDKKFTNIFVPIADLEIIHS